MSDNVGGARRLTEKLMSEVAAKGLSPADLVYLGGVRGEFASDNRVAGFTEALVDHGFEVDEASLHRCGYPPESACEALESCFRRMGRLPAGLLVNSIAAFEGLVQFAARRPKGALDGLVVGCFDWDPFAAHLPYCVTMLRQNVEAMIGEAFEALSPDRQSGATTVVVPPVWGGIA